MSYAVSSTHLSPINLLGERVDGTFTAEDAMKKGKLAGWNVRKVPATATDPETGAVFPKPGMSDVLRDNPETGATELWSRYNVSNSFGIMQNEAHAEFLNTLVDESGAHFELAGTHGRKVFLSMRLPGHILIGGVDPVDLSLLSINSHDGACSFTLAPMPVRYACKNLLNTKFGSMSNVIRLRHTAGMTKGLVERARAALNLTFDYIDELSREGELLIQKSLSESRFEEIITAEFGAAEDAGKATVTRSEKRIEEMMELFTEAETQANIRGTAWAGFNALTEWADHFSPARGEDRELARASRAVLDPDFKNTALRIMQAV